ncbi:hypothetical protein ACWJJH_00290 [Endozoicomonadaceae bacterium StTr2]
MAREADSRLYAVAEYLDDLSAKTGQPKTGNNGEVGYTTIIQKAFGTRGCAVRMHHWVDGRLTINLGVTPSCKDSPSVDRSLDYLTELFGACIQPPVKEPRLDGQYYHIDVARFNTDEILDMVKRIQQKFGC